METISTLREFSVDVTNKKGTEFRLSYGYDLSKATGGFYLVASIDDKAAKSTKAVIKRVRALGIESINSLIDLLECDGTGMVTSLYDLALSDITVDKLTNSLRLTQSRDIDKVVKLVTKLNDMHKAGKSDKAISGVYTRYLNSQRLRLLLDVRSTIQGLRKLDKDGLEYNGDTTAVQYNGYLATVDYPMYYKRDINLIRLSRVRLYKEVLKKEYVPVKD